MTPNLVGRPGSLHLDPGSAPGHPVLGRPTGRAADAYMLHTFRPYELIAVCPSLCHPDSGATWPRAVTWWSARIAVTGLPIATRHYQ